MYIYSRVHKKNPMGPHFEIKWGSGGEIRNTLYRCLSFFNLTVRFLSRDRSFKNMFLLFKLIFINSVFFGRTFTGFPRIWFFIPRSPFLIQQYICTTSSSAHVQEILCVFIISIHLFLLRNVMYLYLKEKFESSTAGAI